jgi:hypothetical protein
MDFGSQNLRQSKDVNSWPSEKRVAGSGYPNLLSNLSWAISATLGPDFIIDMTDLENQEDIQWPEIVQKMSAKERSAGKGVPRDENNHSKHLVPWARRLPQAVN